MMAIARPILLIRAEPDNFRFLKTVIPDTLFVMIYSKKFLVIGISLGVSALALSACQHPNAMPSGYTHHHEVFKSPDPAPVLTLQTTDNQDIPLSLMDIDMAVEDLLRKVTARAGLPPKPVYILTPPKMTSFYSLIDSALRKNMRDLGYAISDTETGAYAFVYNARELRKPRGTENDGFPNVELVLQVYSALNKEARLLTEQSGNYFIEGASHTDIKPVIYSSRLPYDSSSTPFIEEMSTVSVETAVKTMPRPAPAYVSPKPIESDATVSRPSILDESPVIVSEDPIVPEIDFKSLSHSTSDDIIVFDQEVNDPPTGKMLVVPEADEAYGDKPVLNDRPSMIPGRVSRKVEY
jgi:hypothetical protein